MPLDQLDTATGLVFQLSGAREAPPVLYLPGVHGDEHLRAIETLAETHDPASPDRSDVLGGTRRQEVIAEQHIQSVQDHSNQDGAHRRLETQHRVLMAHLVMMKSAIEAVG